MQFNNSINDSGELSLSYNGKMTCLTCPKCK